MRQQIKVFLAVLSTLVLLLASVFTAVAGGPQLHSSLNSGSVLSEAGALPEAAIGACTKMQVSDPALWFATDSKGNVYPDKVVDQYPTGTTYIAAGFEYNCIPKNTTLTVVYYFGGTDTEPVFTDSSKEAPSSSSGTYYWYIGYDDGTTLPEGDWQVEWYVNKELATSGQITVGGGTKNDIKDLPTQEAQPTEQPTAEPTTSVNDIWDFPTEQPTPANSVTVQGTVVDGKTKKPIAGALFVVLNSGITAQEWSDKGFPAEDVFTGAQTDAKGEFVCQQQLDRNVTYSVLVGAKGYQMVVADDFVIDDKQPDPVDLTIKMYK